MTGSVYLILLIVTLTTFAHKCQITRHADQIIADCTRLELKNVPTGLPLDISGLDLSFNQISTIQKKSFGSFSSLTALTMDFNNIRTIDGDVFNGLENVRWLSMKHNQLNISSKIFDVVFKPLIHLQHLDIRYNIDKRFNQSKPMVYPYFGNLHNLTDLYMDLAQNPVFKFSGFENITHLSTIRFAKCYLNQMSNDTLEELPPTITAIYFHECTGTIKIGEADFLKPFPLLEIFNMEGVAIQLEDAFKLLYPFTNKTMTSIIFKDIRPHVPKPVFLYHNMTNYLIHICVKTLVLAESEIVGYENGLLLDFKFPQCLENVVLSGNRFSIALGPHLQELMVIMKMTTNLKFF
ncbi:unnamed protein product [Mytilus edulis]|uniref:Uncharacterized protein n=1 Tax=Mytilus edulis TaxID=6550 RepID=A0A8S3TRF6_MYTED|nr:unnamed protein product [Mytilus edulis]